ncbi:hypothetical protein RYA05_13745 [Pseudomonas syringae pv. actinidiae]|uniref:hypothetical protein n=1 Tax=Pseudomonas viridiflava TaxID=33069 RepID=UPI0018E60640|nr:hypothetical protein [Pseudomonas viridiflava]MBI6727550.1 hypothetical protein [Pseudomonas viridiflava]MDU8352920.1 hypothetical protein [Pseudomonas syringae pv. actinidiae]
MSQRIINPNAVEVEAMVRQAIDGDGVLKVMDAAFYHQFKMDSVQGFCLFLGLYALPTTELLDRVNLLIMEASPSRNAIEVASGNGCLGKGLGIQCTDNYMQADEDIKAHLMESRQAPVSYGQHVAKYDALEAVDVFRPEVVVAAWMTHKYRPHEHYRGGNMYGIEENDMMTRIKRYILVGNREVHKHKPLMEVPHQCIQGDFIVSRSSHPSKNAIFVWDADKIERLP